MQYREIITDSWDLTKKHSYLNWLAAIPLGLEFILAVVYVPVRFGLYIIPDMFARVTNLVQEQFVLHSTETISVAVFFGVVFILFLLVPPFFEGALISTIAKIVHGGEESVKSQHSIAFGLNKYLPLVELHGMTALLNPLFVVLSMSLLHQFNESLFNLFIWPAVFLFIVEVIIYFTLIYSDYELIINDSGVLTSMMKSIKIVIFNISETFFTITLLLLIVGRAIVNFLIVFLIPGIIYFLVTYFLSFISEGALLALISIGFIVSYYYALKTASVLVVFTNFVFTITFFNLISNNADVILKPKEEVKEKEPLLNPNPTMPSDALEILGRTLIHEMEKIALERKKSDQEADLKLPAGQEHLEKSDLPKNPSDYVRPDLGISKHTFETEERKDPNSNSN